jgi:hypothetical protein
MILSANQQTVVCPSLPSLLKRDLAVNPNHFSRRHNLFFLLAISVSSLVLIPCLSKALAMAASHPHLFQSSVADESEIRKLVVNHFTRTMPCCNGAPPPVKIFLHPIRMKLWCFSPFNADSVSRPAISFTDSLITTKSN